MISTRSPRGTVRDEVLGGPQDVAEQFPLYLRDESRMQGYAERVLFPEDEAEIAAILTEAGTQQRTVTVSAGRTGVVGGAVPLGGWGLSVERLKHVMGFSRDATSGEFRIRVGPGLPLVELNQALRTGIFPWAGPDRQGRRSGPLASGWRCSDGPACDADRVALEEFRREGRHWVFPPDPTEVTAQLGGMTASNASGARTFCHGPTRNHVRGLVLVLASGKILDIRRGETIVPAGASFAIQDLERVLSIPAPDYPLPRTKHAGGFFSAPHLDLIDLIIGSEGTLGVISEIEFALTRVPEHQSEILAILPDTAAACRMVRELRQRRDRKTFLLESLEFMDSASLAMLAEHNQNPFGRQGELMKDSVAVFAGLRFPESPDDALEEIETVLGKIGANPDLCLMAMNSADLERFRSFRHALPETVNNLVAALRTSYPDVTKLGTDMAVPDEHLEAILELYSRRLGESGLFHVIFGHLGNNHLHVNIIPRNPSEFELGKTLYLEFAREVVAMRGSVSAEHGIGKLKRYLLSTQFPETVLEEMKAIKSAFDPRWILGPGTLFPVRE